MQIRAIVPVLLALVAASAPAQVSNPSIVPVGTAPSGACSQTLPLYIAGQSAPWFCNAGVWTQLGSASGGDSITSPASTLTVGGGPTATTLDVNLSNANTWLALQTFGLEISIAGVTPTGSTGTGNIVFGTNPTLSAPLLGTPTSGVITNLSGTCA